jgi:hypothetical protein
MTAPTTFHNAKHKEQNRKNCKPSKTSFYANANPLNISLINHKHSFTHPYLEIIID